MCFPLSLSVSLSFCLCMCVLRNSSLLFSPNGFRQDYELDLFPVLIMCAIPSTVAGAFLD